MELLKFFSKSPENSNGVPAEELKEVEAITAQLNEIHLRASKIEKKMDDKNLSSEDILELENEKVNLIAKSRKLSEERVAIFEKFNVKK